MDMLYADATFYRVDGVWRVKYEFGFTNGHLEFEGGPVTDEDLVQGLGILAEDDQKFVDEHIVHIEVE